MKKFTLMSCGFILVWGLTLWAGTSSQPEKGRWDFKKIKLWESEMEGKVAIGSIQSLKISPRGRVYMIDRKNFKVCIFGRDGQFLNAFGRRGEGPGEIRDFYGGDQLHLTESSLIIEDRNRVHYFTPEGKFKRTIQIPSRLRARKFISDDLLVSAPVTVDNRNQKGAEILVYNIKTGEQEVIDTFNPFARATDTQRSGGRTMTVGIVIGNITPLMFLGYRNDTLYYGMSSKYRINYVNLKTRDRGEIFIKDRQPHPVSKKYKEDLKKGLGDVPAEMLKRIIDGLPPHASFYEAIIPDDNGNFYVVVSNPDLTHRKDIDIFNRKGKYIYAAQISIDAGSTINNIRIRGNRLVLAIEDEEGNERIACYRITAPEL